MAKIKKKAITLKRIKAAKKAMEKNEAGCEPLVSVYRALWFGEVKLSGILQKRIAKLVSENADLRRALK